ncbi:MAG: ankyrin repeat domain-containing protein [Bacteroidota bacterium]
MSPRLISLVIFAVGIISSCAPDPKEQLSKQDIDFNKESFIEVAENGNIEAVKLFIKAGMKVDVANGWQETALIKSAEQGNVETASYLLENGAYIDMREMRGKTPLLVAAEAGHAELVDLLLENGAYVDTRGARFRFTPLIYASFNGHFEVVKVLVNNGADVNATNKDGGTSLMNASFNGHVDIVRYLIAQGANLNAQLNENGYSALMFAAEKGNTETVQVLIDAGCDPQLEDDKGRTAADIAREFEHPQVVEVIKSDGQIN